MKRFEELKLEDFSDKIRMAATTASPLFCLYGFTYMENGVPTLNDIITNITKLTTTALREYSKSTEDYPHVQVGSGRFIVEIKAYEEEVMFRISLNLEEMTCL